MIDKIELGQKILNVLKKEFFAIDEFVIAKITNDYIDQLNILGNITEDSVLKKLRTSIIDLSSTDSVFARGNPNVPNTSSSFAQSYIEKSIAIYSSFGTGNSQNTMSQIDFNLYGPFESLGSFSPELTRASFYNWGERVSGNDYDTPVIVIGGAWGNTTFGPHSGYALGVVDSFGSGIITASTGFGNLLYIKPATSSITAALFNETGINNDSVTRNLTLTAYSNLIPGINPTAGISISFGGTGQSGNLVFGGASLNTQTNNIKFFSPLTVSNSNKTDTLILGLSSTGGASNTQYFAGVGTAQYILSTNISSFNAGDIFYSSGSGHTFLTRLPIGSSNQVLSVSGSTLVWSGSSITATNVNIANALASSFHPIVFTPSTSSSGSALSANTTLVYNPGTDNLYVSGLFVTSASNAVSYTQGAATITGGLAVSNIHVNNRVTAGVITSGGTATSRVEMYVDSNVNYGLRVFRRTDAVPRIELTNNAFPNSQSEIPGLVFRTSGTGGTCGIGGINNSSGFMALWTRGASGPEIRLTIQDNVDAQNIIVLGSNTSGTGKTSTLRGTDASGTDIAGNDLIIYAGQPTGSGTVAPIRFRAPNQGSSSSSLNTLLDVVRIGAINNAQSATGLTVTLYVSGGLAVTGNAFIGGTVTAPTFIGNLTGTATTATTANSWTTARTLSITGDGTGSTTLSGAGDTTIYLTLSATQPNITSAANLATIGTITSGVWKGSLIGVTYGGTGSNLGSASGDSNKLIVTGTPSTGFASQLIDGANTGHILVARGNGQAPYFSDTTASAFTFSSGLVSINNAAITQGTISTTPTNDNDLVPKSYVDSVASGLDIHESVRLTTLSGIAASYVRISGLASSSNDLDGYLISSSFEALNAATGLDTFSGNALTTGQRLLIKDGVTGSYKKGSDPYVAFSTLTTYGAFGASYIANGIYKIIATGGVGSNWIFQRAIDTDDNIELTGGTFTFIQEGGTYADNSFVCTVDTIANGPIGFGSTQITWSAFSTGALVIEQGLTKSATNIALNFNLTGDQVVSGYTFRGFTLGGNRSGATGYSSDASFTVSSHQGANAPVASTLTLNTTGYKLAGGLTSKYLTVSTDLSLDPYSSGGIAFYSGTALSSNSQFVISGTGISINHGTNSSTNSTGALVLNGGLGVTGNAFIGGTVTLSNNTNSISSSSGSLVITGGVGVGGTISVGQRLSVGSNLNSSSTTTGALVNSGGLGMVGNAFIGGTVTMSDTTNSTSSSTGSLVVSGGVGAGGTINIGQRLSVGSNLNSSSTTSGAIVNSGGLGMAGNAFIGGTVNITSNSLGSYGSTTSGALVVTGGVGVGGSVYIGGQLGVGGTIDYNAINNIAYFAANVNSYAQVIAHNHSNGNSASSDFVVSNDLATDTAYYGDFGMNSSGWAATTSAFNTANAVYLVSNTGDLAIGSLTANPIRFFYNNGVTDLAYMGATGMTVLYATNSESTTTGALVVRGGLGLTGNAFIGGTVTVTDITNSSSINTGSVKISGGIGIGQSASIGGRLQLFNGANYTAFVSTATANTTYLLPPTPPTGAGNSVLQSTPQGTLSWVPMTTGGSATPGGSDTQIQFNDGGSFGGATGFTFDKITNAVSIGTSTILTSTSERETLLRIFASQAPGSIYPTRYSGRMEFVSRAWDTVQLATFFKQFVIDNEPVATSYEGRLRFRYRQGTGLTDTFNNSLVEMNSLYGLGIGNTNSQYLNYFRTSTSQAANKTYVLPIDYPTSGSVGSSVLSSDTSGNLNWVNMSSGGPGGGTVNSGTAGSIAIYSGTTAVSAFPDLSIASSGSGISIFSAMNFRGGNELRLSASGNAAYTALKSATVSTYTLTLPTAAPTSIGNSYLTADTSGNMYWQPAVREQSHRIVFAAGLNPTLGADSAVHMIPFAYQDGFTSVTYRLRRVDCRVETTASGSGAGNTSVFSIEKYAYNAGAGIFTFSTSSTGSTSNIMSIPISIGGAGVAETYWATFAGSHVTSVSGDKLRLNFSTLNAVHTNFSISLIMEAE